MADKPDEPKIHTGDKALIKAALTGEGSIRLTSEHFKQIQENLNARTKDIDERYPKLVEQCPYETRLAVAAWVFKHICDHAKEGGTFRYLIYERLGFDLDAYVPLYTAGGMTISNEFNLNTENHDEKAKENEKDEKESPKA